RRRNAGGRADDRRPLRRPGDRRRARHAPGRDHRRGDRRGGDGGSATPGATVSPWERRRPACMAGAGGTPALPGREETSMTTWMRNALIATLILLAAGCGQEPPPPEKPAGNLPAPAAPAMTRLTQADLDKVAKAAKP